MAAEPQDLFIESLAPGTDPTLAEAAYGIFLQAAAGEHPAGNRLGPEPIPLLIGDVDPQAPAGSPVPAAMLSLKLGSDGLHVHIVDREGRDMAFVAIEVCHGKLVLDYSDERRFRAGPHSTRVTLAERAPWTDPDP